MFYYYNNERPHPALDIQCPAERYVLSPVPTEVCQADMMRPNWEAQS